MTDDHKFQVNLRGVIDLLSHHLYSGPQVYIRELLQNAVDAIAARKHFQKEHQGEIRIEAVPGTESQPMPTLVVYGLGGLLLLPAAYTGWSIKRYFGIPRAMGGDHRGRPEESKSRARR